MFPHDNKPMKRKTLIIVLFLAANVVVFMGLINWRFQKQEQARIMLRDATRYAGVTGSTITAFDERTNRWIAEMEEESIEVTLQKLTDTMEYVGSMSMEDTSFLSFDSEENREKMFYRGDIETLLGNRRFRKAYEDLQKTDRKKASELLAKNIRDNLAELRTMLQEDMNTVLQGRHKMNVATMIAIPDPHSYRNSSHPDHPPTRTGRRYAVFSYIWLASLLELREVRPAVEEVVQFAKMEYRLFNDVGNTAASSFKGELLRQSLYNPSILVTAMLCDPTWHIEKREAIKEKLVHREVVDYRSQLTEYDMRGGEGWATGYDMLGRGDWLPAVPVVPHEGMLKILYYDKITDDEFNAFFGE